jgi:hypothetical protein
MKIISADKKLKNDRLVFIFSIILFLYIAFVISSYKLGFDDIVIIGVFRELLDIPAFALLAIFFVLSSISFIKEKIKFSSYPFYSIIVLFITAAALIILL